MFSQSAPIREPNFPRDEEFGVKLCKYFIAGHYLCLFASVYACVCVCVCVPACLGILFASLHGPMHAKDLNAPYHYHPTARPMSVSTSPPTHAASPPPHLQPTAPSSLLRFKCALRCPLRPLTSINVTVHQCVVGGPQPTPRI